MLLSWNDSKIGAFRALAFILIFYLKKTLGLSEYNLVFIGILFSHYLGAFVWPVKSSFTTGQWFANLLKILLATLLAVFVYFQSLKADVDLLYCFFGLHFVLSEVYIVNLGRSHDIKYFNFFRIIHFSFVYAAITNNFSPTFHKTFLLASIVTFCISGFLVYRINPLSFKRFFKLDFIFVILLLFVLINGKSPFFSIDIAFYHVVFYIFYILDLGIRRNIKQAYKEHLFLILSFCFFIFLEVKFTFLSYGSVFFAFLHICQSLALSKFNPNWVLRLLGIKRSNTV